MSTDTTEGASSSTKKAAIEAVGTKTRTAATGDVLTFQVKSSVKPTFETSDDCPPLYSVRDGSGNWSASWVPTSEGEHTVTVSVDNESTVFTINAKEK